MSGKKLWWAMKTAEIPNFDLLGLSEDQIESATAAINDFESFCADLETTEGQPLTLEPFQRLIIASYFAGFSEVLALIPKGNGKTVLLAALAVHHLKTTNAAEAYIGASSAAQAQKMYREASRFARQVDLLPFPGYMEIRVHKDPSFGYLRVLASDKADRGSLEGIGPTLGLVDELHAHVNDALYAAMHGALHKRDGRMLTISTAGSDEDSVLGRIRAKAFELPSVDRDEALTIAHDDAFVMFEWAVAEGADLDDLEVVKTANPASFVTLEKLKRIKASPSMTPSRWSRYHSNVWTPAQDQWLPAGVWDACYDADAKIPEGADVYLGVDVGIKKDTSAIAVLHKREDERIVVEAHVFAPDGDQPLDLSKLEGKIREIADRYRVMSVSYDRWTFERSAQMLSDEGLLMVEFPMTNDRTVPASNRLYEAIQQHRVVHDGNPVLAAHVKAGATRDTERGWRLTKGKSKKPIDALIATMIAFPQADQSSTGGGFEW
jgi:phage terminase large subunit-like protein